MENYNILDRVGEGAHGVVFKAKHIQSGEIVALKRVSLKKLDEGIPNNVLREIKALQAIEENENVVKLLEHFAQGTGFVLVFEYMLSDLAEVIRNSEYRITEAQVKSYMKMLLHGVAFCHENSIMHRDLKPANLLISSTGHLKVRTGWSKFCILPCILSRIYLIMVIIRIFGKKLSRVLLRPGSTFVGNGLDI